KTLREDRTAAIRNHVAKATRRRRRIPQAGFLLVRCKKQYTMEGYVIMRVIWRMGDNREGGRRYEEV
ncbi:hypothetical protein, partial [Anaerostipes sp.]|uniref:hypothetical protein n=1 Tax=Anaerostipes sp. TaxID=1872530 RepID=UPI0025C1B242